MSFAESLNLYDADGNLIDAQYPLPSDLDSAYQLDIKDSLSDVGTFTGADLKTLFNNIDDSITDTSATNPKYFKFFLERPIKTGSIALVAQTGSFKNVKITFTDRQSAVLATIDDSANSTAYTSHEYSVAGVKNVCCVLIEFYTTDPVTVSFIYFRKTIGVTVDSISSIVSEKNSSATPLLAAGVFTGDIENIKDTGSVSIAVYSDVASATDGLSVQFSTDGVNWDHSDGYTIAATTGKTYSIQPVAKFFRIVYTNGGLDQTEFRLQTIFRTVYSKPSSHRMADSVSGQDDAELVKAGITGEREDSVFGNVRLDNQDNLKVNSLPFTYAVSSGAVTGKTSLLKFGTRTSVAAATASSVWEGPTALYAYMSSAQQLKITSTDNVNDNVGGTGALTLTIEGLDSNWEELIETVTMTGTTAATTIGSFIRVYRAYVATCGTSYANTGTISIKNNASTVTQAIINIGESQTLMTLWTVPSGKKAFIVQGTASTDSNKGARISLFVRLNDGGILYPWLLKYRAYLFSGNEVFPFVIPFPIPAKTDIEVRVDTPGSAGTTAGGATFELWYEDV